MNYGIRSHQSLKDVACHAIFDGKQRLPANAVDANRTRCPRAIFDFDNTLTREVVFNDLVEQLGGAAPTREKAQAMSDQWWVHEFGGLERIRKLDSMMNTLTAMGVELYICSRNNDAVIVEGLRRVGLLQYFQAGNDVRIIPQGLGDKGRRVQQNLSMSGIAPCKACFVDDERDNIAIVEKANPGIKVLQCSEFGVTEQDSQRIIAHFRQMLTYN